MLIEKFLKQAKEEIIMDTVLLWYCKQNVTDSLSKIGTSSTLKTLKKP